MISLSFGFLCSERTWKFFICLVSIRHFCAFRNSPLWSLLKLTFKQICVKVSLKVYSSIILFTKRNKVIKNKKFRNRHVYFDKLPLYGMIYSQIRKYLKQVRKIQYTTSKNKSIAKFKSIDNFCTIKKKVEITVILSHYTITCGSPCLNFVIAVFNLSAKVQQAVCMHGSMNVLTNIISCCLWLYNLAVARFSQNFVVTIDHSRPLHPVLHFSPQRRDFWQSRQKLITVCSSSVFFFTKLQDFFRAP